MRVLLITALLFPVYSFAAPVSYVFSGHITNINYPSASFPALVGDTFNGTLSYDTHYNGTWSGQPWPTNTPALLDWSISINGESYSIYSSPLSPASNPLFASGNTVSINSMFSQTAGLPAFNNAGLSFSFANANFANVVPDQLALADFTAGQIFFGGIAGSPGAGFQGSIETLSSVPLPASAWLLGTSLLGLLGIARRA